MARHLSVVPPPDSPAGRLHRAYNAPDLLEALTAVEELRADLEGHQLQLVLRARKGQVTWEAIGAALGTSRQGAFNRYGAVVQRYERTGLLAGVEVVAGAGAGGQAASEGAGPQGC
jgi:hypothetical protein